MIDGADIFASAMVAAAAPGPEESPDALLAVVAKLDAPLNAVAEPEAGFEMFSAMKQSFSFMTLARAGKQPSPEDFERLVALLRWLMREFSEWQAASDTKRKQLAALIVTAQFVQIGGNFWEAVPNGSPPSDDLVDQFGHIAGSINSSFVARFGQPPIWEAEAVERFEKADAAGEWEAIAEGWRLIENSTHPSVVVTQSVQCLCRFYPDRLAQAVVALHQTAAVMMVVRSLRSEDAFRLAAATTNPYVQFAVVYEKGISKPGAEQTTDTGYDLLTEILVKVATDPPRWAAWMKLLNRIPMWFNTIQRSLGRAIAVVDDTASQAYIDTLPLHWPNENGREAVSECLRAFRTAATEDHRRRVWTQAYARWEAWRFDAANPIADLMKIALSVLDYAVVGYVVECLDEKEQRDRLLTINAKLGVCADIWHNDLSACLSEWNRLLSELQPLMHAAAAIQTGADWLMKGRQYFPFDPQVDRYAAMKFHMVKIVVQPVA